MTNNNYADGEELRHIPPVATLIRWVEENLQRDALASASVIFDSLDVPADVRGRAKAIATSICHWLDRPVEFAHIHRAGSAGGDPTAALRQAFSSALEALRTLDAQSFRRKATHNTFDRSSSEQIYGALLIVGCRVRELVDLAASIDRDLRMRLNERIYPPLTIDPELQRILIGSTSIVTSTP
jgi:hypothetical protein